MRAWLEESKPGVAKGLSMAVLGVFVGLGILQLDSLRHIQLGTDHFVYSVAVSKAWRGQDPYLRTPSPWAYLYPPPSLLVVKGAEIITPPGVRPAITFIVLSFIGAVLGVRLLAGPRWWQRWRVAVLLLTSAGFIESTYLGQINGLVIACVSVFLFAWRRESYWLASFALAAAICLKITPLILAVFFLTRTHWKWLMAVAGFVVGWHAIAQLLIPVPHLTGSFIATLWWASEQLNYGPFGILHNYSLSVAVPAFLRALVGVQVPPMAVHRLKLIILMVLVAVTYAFYVRRRRSVDATNALFVQCNLCGFLAPNIVWLHHAALLMPALWVVLVDAESSLLAAVCLAALFCFQAAPGLHSVFGVLPRGPFVAGEVLLLAVGVLLPLVTARRGTQ